jgi:NAD(P)-dependent dehydrogenase (short-subunit alcohol dehydrogenase family)
VPVVAAARSTTSLDEVVEECAARSGPAVAVTTDVRDPQAVQHLAEVAEDRYGRIDMWVNDAAVMAYGTTDRVPTEIERAVIETNLMGTVYGCRAALARFRRQRRGVIVNVASLYAEMVSPFVSSYVTSKFAVLGYSEVLRQDLAGEPDIAVCVILPGSMDTPIFSHAANYTGRSVQPIPPVGDPRRVARAIASCLDRPGRRHTIGTTQRLYSIGNALMPSVYGRLAPLMMERTGFGDEDAPPDSGTVLAPRPSTNACEGGWRRLAASRRWVASVGLEGA